MRLCNVLDYNSIHYCHSPQDHACLRFSPSSGELQLWGSIVVCVECRSERTGQLRSLVECQLNGRPVRCACGCVCIACVWWRSG